jgi:hypothetical protein
MFNSFSGKIGEKEPEKASETENEREKKSVKKQMFNIILDQEFHVVSFASFIFHV